MLNWLPEPRFHNVLQTETTAGVSTSLSVQSSVYLIFNHLRRVIPDMPGLRCSACDHVCARSRLRR